MTAFEDAALRTSDLLQHAHAEGFEVSARQIRRWRQRGLLPRSQQRHPRGTRGSVAVWPAGSDRQFVALCALAERFHRLDALLLAMWWEGWSVDRTALLEQLADRLAGHPLSLMRRDGTDAERLAAIEQVLDRGDVTRLRGPLRQMLRRVGPDEADRQSLLTTVASLGAGMAPPLEVVDVGLDDGRERGPGELVARGFGLEGFARQLTEVGDPTEPEELVEDIAEFGLQVPSMLAFAHAVIESGDLDELCTARDQARALGMLGHLASADLLSDQDGGIGYMGQFMTADDPDGWIILVACVLWLRHLFGERVAEVATPAAHAGALAQLATTIPELREVIPNISDEDEPVDFVASHPDLGEKIKSYLLEPPAIAALLSTE